MIFVQIYIKILGFGQKTILMRVDLFEIFLSETSEICLFFRDFVGLWRRNKSHINPKQIFGCRILLFFRMANTDIHGFRIENSEERASTSATVSSIIPSPLTSAVAAVWGWWGIRNNTETSEIYFFDISLVFVRMSLLFSFLEMLVVLYAAPVAAPTETMWFKSLFAKVVVIDFMWEVLASVRKVGGRGRADACASYARVLQGIDVDGHPKGMTG